MSSKKYIEDVMKNALDLNEVFNEVELSEDEIQEQLEMEAVEEAANFNNLEDPKLLEEELKEIQDYDDLVSNRELSLEEQEEKRNFESELEEAYNPKEYKSLEQQDLDLGE